MEYIQGVVIFGEWKRQLKRPCQLKFRVSGQGGFVGFFMTPIGPIVIPVMPIIKLLTKSPEPSTKAAALA